MSRLSLQIIIFLILGSVSCTGFFRTETRNNENPDGRPSTSPEGVPGYLVDPSMIAVAKSSDGVYAINAPAGSVKSDEDVLDQLVVYVYAVSKADFVKLEKGVGGQYVISGLTPLAELTVNEDGSFQGEVNTADDKVLYFKVARKDTGDAVDSSATVHEIKTSTNPEDKSAAAMIDLDKEELRVEVANNENLAEVMATKLLLDECFDPDLSRLPTDQKVTLCDGSVGEGTLELPAADKILAGTSVGGVAGTLSDRNGAWSLANSWPGSGFYDTQPTFSLANICDDTYLLGMAGTALCRFNDHMASGMGHTKGSQISIADESGTLPANYRLVPKIGFDPTIADDYYRPSSDLQSVDFVVRDTDAVGGAADGDEWGVDASETWRKVCGKTATSIADKIIDCDAKHSAARPDFDTVAGDSKLMWDGGIEGNASEGSWTLVTVYHASKNDGETCDDACYEVWRDERTGLLWSDMLVDDSADKTHNWCHASGSNNNDVPSNPYGEEDPSGICDNVANQRTTYIGADPEGTLPISLCAEHDGFLYTPDWTFDEKGGMGADTSVAVRWRLPTIYDWFQALANGMFSVLPNLSGNFWSASVYAGDRDFAWVFTGTGGFIGFIVSRSTVGSGSARCVGVP